MNKANILNIGNKKALDSAVSLISQGEAIIIPTETVYGIVADAENLSAIDRIYEIKGRPREMALQVLASNLKEAQKIGIFDDKALKISQKFWPGPLTIVLKRKPDSMISPAIAQGKDTIGIRVPDHKFTQQLLKAYGKPLAATSANLTGGKSPTNIDELNHEIVGKLRLVIDGGECNLKIASTVIDFSGRGFKILRAGSISEEAIKNLL